MKEENKENKSKENAKKTIKISTVIVIIMFILLLLGVGVMGYSTYTINQQLENKTKELEQTRKITNETIEKYKTIEEDLSKKDIKNEVTNEPIPEKVTKTNLTSTELDTFTKYLIKAENNGFILSEYSNIYNVNVGLLIRDSGIGEVPSSDYQGVYKEYQESNIPDTAMNEPNMPIYKYTEDSINNLLKEKTGKTFNKLNNMENYAYSPKYKAYYNMHGDTIIEYKATAISGYKTSDGKYVVNGKYNNSLMYNPKTNKNITEFTVTLQKQGNSYLFISNSMK